MSDDLNKTVDVVVDDRKKLHDEAARHIIEAAEGYMSELISKQLGYEYGNGYRAGFNELQYVCRTLASQVAALKMGKKLGPNLDPTAAAFVKEAERTYTMSWEVNSVVMFNDSKETKA